MKILSTIILICLGISYFLLNDPKMFVSCFCFLVAEKALDLVVFERKSLSDNKKQYFIYSVFNNRRL